MRYSVKTGSAKTAYLQLYEQLREDIVNGFYPFGSKLPSKRLVSEECGVSVITAEHAFALLCDEGYIEAKQRSGFYVIYQREQAFSSPKSSEIKPHVFSSHQSGGGEFPFTVYARTMRKVLSEYGEEILEKSPNQGKEILRKELALYLGRSRGIHVLPEQIMIGAGAEYFYGILVQFLGRDKLFALEDPSYEQIDRVYRSCGAKTEFLPLKADGICSAALQKSRADVLHITPYRSFPSGVSANVSKKREYLRWAEKGDRILVEDDFESEFSLSRKPEETLFSMSDGDHVIYMNTFSQTVAPSIRAGYMVLPARLVPRFQEKLGFYSCTVPVLEQLTLAELLVTGEFERHINRVRRKKRKEK